MTKQLKKTMISLRSSIYFHLFLKNMLSIHTGTQVAHLLYFDCKIGDFKIAGCVCLQKKVYLPSLLQGIFW